MNRNAPFFRLYRRTSAKGNTYHVGRLGQAKVIAFPGKAEDGTETLEIFLCGDQAMRERAERPAAADRGNGGEPLPNRFGTRQRRPAPAAADDGDGLDWERGDPLPFG